MLLTRSLSNMSQAKSAEGWEHECMDERMEIEMSMG